MRLYKKELVQDIKRRQYRINKDGLDILYKPLPETDQKGVRDLRIASKQKFENIMARFLPLNIERIIQNLNIDDNLLQEIRDVFNQVNSQDLSSQIKKDKIIVNDLFMNIFYQDNDHSAKKVIYYLHGGGFIAGNTKVVEDALKLLVELTDCVVFSYDYRLAPEYPYPASHQDAYDGLNWVYDNLQKWNGSTEDVFVAGDSAGGNLALYCLNQDLMFKRSRIAGQILLYPTLDFSNVLKREHMLNSDNFEMSSQFQKLILNELYGFHHALKVLPSLLKTKDVSNFKLSPFLYPDKNLPPTLIVVGEHDYLKLESISYAQKLHNLGVKVDIIIYKGITHAFIDELGNLPQAEDSIKEIASWLDKRSQY